MNNRVMLCLVIAVATVTPCESQADELQAGVATIDITPPIGYRMSGYFYERPSTGIHDPLQAKALVLLKGETKVAWVFCDLVGIAPTDSSPARAMASNRTGIPRENILVAATHSHTGPLYWGVLRDPFLGPRSANRAEVPQHYRSALSRAPELPNGRKIFAAIPRQDLESLLSSNTSLMPEGLERQISLQQMADLTGYLRNWREIESNSILVAKVPPSALTIATSVICQGSYPKHLQGICTDGKEAIFWSFTTFLVKTDLNGKVLVKVPVADHHGDLCYHDGKVFVAVNLGEFNQPAGRADSWVYVYDADSLKELKRHVTPEVVHGAGGIAYHDGRFIVVGGLPDGVEQNYLYEFDDKMSFMKRHVLTSGHTHLGIQTASYHNGHWWFGCYGQPPQLLKADESFQLLGRWDFDCSLGIVGLKPGELLVASGKKHKGKHTGQLHRAAIDNESGLRRISPE